MDDAIGKLVRLCGALIAAAVAGGAARAEDPDPFAGPAFLVRNIDPGVDLEESSEPGSFVAAGDLVFFTANDGEHGRELWRTDGTAAGTVLVRDFAPGKDDGFRDFAVPVAFGELVALRADNALWRSDGTTEGTFALLDEPVGSMASVAGLLFLTTCEAVEDGSHRHLLWRSDGSRDGTVAIRSFASDCYDALDLRAAADRLYAIGYVQGAPILRIWAAEASDLAAATLEPAAPIELALGSSYDRPRDLRASVGDLLLFVASSPAAKTELWRSDGTAAGTFALLQGEGPAGPFYEDQTEPAPHFREDGARVFFIASDGVHGLEPWVSDGTVEGTRMVADVVAGPQGVYPCASEYDRECERQAGIENPRVNLIPGDTGLLIARSYSSGDDYSGANLWVSDGTTAGTRQVEGALSDLGLSSPSSVAGRAPSLLFQVWGDEGAQGVWYGDGTVSGSRRVATVEAENIHAAANGFIFVGWDPAGAQREPWWSDGTPEGTYLLRDIRRGDAAASPRDLTELNGTLLFSAAEAEHGRELWRSDGSDAGTALVADIRPGSADSAPAEITRIGDIVLFAADDGAHGVELWRSDGTSGGTGLVADIQPGAASANPNRLAAVDGALYFYADDGVHGVELWTSDGSAAGTVLVADVNRNGDGGERIDDPFSYGIWGPQNRYVAGFDGAVFFAADDGVHGVELWRSEGPGTPARLVADTRSGAESGWPHSLLAAGGALYFNVFLDSAAETSSNQLWRSDGSTGGTTAVLAPPLVFNAAAHRIDGAAVFLAEDPALVENPAVGLQLWRVAEGGAETTAALPDFYAEERFQAPIGAAGSIFFAGYAGLWRSDLGLLEPSYYFSDRFTSLTNVADRILFAVRDRWDDRLNELWTADGAPFGTRRLQYLPQPQHSYFADDERRDWLEEPTFVAAGAHVFFAGDIGDTGRELWALPLDVLPEVQPAAPPTATIPPGGAATPTPTATLAPTATASAPPQSCALDGDPPNCARAEVRDTSAAAGESASISVRLRSLGEGIAGVQVDLTVDTHLRIARKANGDPQCSVDAALEKEASAFAFVCDRAGGACATVRAIIFSITNFDPIDDGATLFSCAVEVGEDAAPGNYAIALSRVGAANGKGAEVAIGSRDGALSVVARSQSNVELGSESSGSCSIQGQPTGSLAPLAAALLLMTLLRDTPRRRKSRSRLEGR